MIEFGKTLRAAREGKELTIAQLAEMTHMTTNTISELENEDFSHIPAPIYGRGFVKLYCETVGLDPKPLLDEFMDILNGNRDTNIRERPTAAATVAAPEADPAETEPPEPVVKQRTFDDVPTHGPSMPLPRNDAPAAPEPASASAPRQPTVSQQDFFRSTPSPTPSPEVTPKPAPTQGRSAAHRSQQAPASAAASEQSISRYAAPVGRMRTFPFPAYWRLALLGAAALVAVLLVILGLRALYHATRATPAAAPVETEVAVTQTPAEEKAKPAPAATKPANGETKPLAAKPVRTPQRIPHLYSD